MNTKIENCNLNLLENQKQQLSNEIIYGKNNGYFAVFDIEAGCRKTRTAEQALIHAYEQGRKSIFVRLSNKDCRESMDIINQIAKKEIAFAYNNEDVTATNIRTVNKNLSKIPILIITHQKYRVLMKDSNKRKMFSNERENLVIDEFIDAVETISLSESDVETYRALFINDAVIATTFEKAMYQVVDFLNTWNKKDTTRRLVTMTDKHPAKDFDQLIKLIRCNITNDMLIEWKNKILQNPEKYSINFDLLTMFNTQKKLCDQILCYKQFFLGMCLYNDQKLYTTDKRGKYWFLNNNIMLDASGELQSAYSLDEENFKLCHCEKVLDYKKWKIINIPINTTTSGKEKILNFYEMVNSIIKKYGDDILVIGRKDEMSMISVPQENKGYFGNVTGSNAWHDKKNVAVIQTHNLSDVDYILKYLHYTKKEIEKEFDLTTKCNGRKAKKLYSFNDYRLEGIRVKWIASEIYQAVKRVNRNMIHYTDVLIFINNMQVIGLLKEQMTNCDIEILECDDNMFVFKRGKQDEYLDLLKKDSYATRFIDFLSEIQNGLHPEFLDANKRISKKEIREYLGIKSSGNFSNKVLNKTDVIQYCEVRNIDIKGNYIRLPNVG